MLHEQHTDVFCDWLDFTLPADRYELSDLIAEFHVFNFVESTEDSLRTPCGRGVLKFTKYSSVIRVSLSGACLTYIRLSGHFKDFIYWLSERPHHITRFDAALDISVPAPSVLSDLIRKYRGKDVKLGQRGLPVTTILTANDLGDQTGTFYVGHRKKAAVTARVYDKQFEALEKNGALLPPTTRYEITVRGDRSKKSPCLNDLFDPRSIFYEYASPALLKRPSGIASWSPDSSFSFTPEVSPGRTAYERASELVDEAGLLRSLARYAGDMGPHGVPTVLRMVEKRLRSLEASEGVSGAALSSIGLSDQPASPA